jgi:hypothetical protein
MSKTPSIAVIPSGYKGGVQGEDGTVYSVLPTNGDADLEFTRDCVATRINQNGLIEEVGLNVPRLDYSDGGCPSLLLEPQRTNLVPFSEDFTQSNWLNIGNPTITPNYGVSPNGTLSSTRLQYGGSDNSLYESLAHTIGDSASIYVKGTNGETIQFGAGGNVAAGVLFTLNGDWQKIEYQSDGGNQFCIGTFKSATARDIEIFGAQLEEGSYATSYIPTSGAEVTRFKDEASKDNLESYINSSEGVLYAELNIGNISDASRYLSISDGSTSNRIRLYIGTNSSVIYGVLNDVISQGYNIGTTSYNKVAVKWKQNEFKFFVNGVLISSNNDSITLPIGMNRIGFDRGNGSSASLFGKTKDLRVYNEALTDDELIALTQ